jgi:DNA replication licensing factor MCM4
MAEGQRAQAPSMAGVGEDVVVWGTTVNVGQCQQALLDFLHHFGAAGPGGAVYPARIKAALAAGSVELDCSHLRTAKPDLYRQLVNYPTEVVPLFDIVVNQLAKELTVTTDMAASHHKLLVRPFGLHERKPMRELNPQDLDKLISVEGMITRTSGVMPDLKEAFFSCVMCSNAQVVGIDRGRINEPIVCSHCHTRQSMQLIHNRCLFADKQITKLQETPGT